MEKRRANATETELALYRWQEENFDSTSPERLALGAIEELGELHRATNEREEDDGIGDCLIYLSQLRNCYGLGSVFQTERGEGSHLLYGPYTVNGRMGSKIHAAARLAHVVLKRQQGIRKVTDAQLDAAITDLAEVACWEPCSGKTPNQIFEETAKTVMERNWRAFPGNGRDK